MFEFEREEGRNRLIGVEHIVDNETFSNLPAEEQLLWHSHRYGVCYFSK
jgi:hypothetical protein